MVKKWDPPLNGKGRPMTEGGAEILDPRPMAPPVGYVAQESMFDVVQRMIMQHAARVQGMEEFESPEEADDFEVGDEDEPVSPYELDAIADLAELERLRGALDGRIGELRASQAPAAQPSSAGPGSSAVGGAAPAGGGGASSSAEGPAGGPAVPKG